MNQLNYEHLRTFIKKVDELEQRVKKLESEKSMLFPPDSNRDVLILIRREFSYEGDWMRGYWDGDDWEVYNDLLDSLPLRQNERVIKWQELPGKYLED